MVNIQHANRLLRASTQATRRVLNAGSGFQSSRQLHPVFNSERWEQIRLDVDPGTEPDLLGSIIDMSEQVPTGSFDAIWCSHALEHLFTHEVSLAISEFRRSLKDDGFVLIRSPDLEAVASLIIEHGTDYVAYQAPAGPITPLDMVFGHSASIAHGRINMSHKTGFTCARLGRLLLDAGFTDALVKRENLELWALAFVQNSDQEKILQELLLARLNFRESST